MITGPADVGIRGSVVADICGRFRQADVLTGLLELDENSRMSSESSLSSGVSIQGSDICQHPPLPSISIAQTQRLGEARRRVWYSQLTKLTVADTPEPLAPGGSAPHNLGLPAKGFIHRGRAHWQSTSFNQRPSIIGRLL
jgi:hypothetical protein